MGDYVLEKEIGEATVTSIEEMLQQDVEDNIEEFEDLNENKKTSNIYRGKALDNIELYQMTAKYETKLILVAGLVHSGKTTMEVAFYQMFLRGVNKRLQFAGSQTLMDVVERSKGLRITSGNAIPTVVRTSTAIEDNYLHIAIVDKKHKRHNLIFTDFAGEVFDYDTANNNGDYLEKFVGLKHVVILVDGEKLSGRQKDQALLDCKNVLLTLLQRKIISNETTVHIVYSKNDMILASKNPNIEKIISNNNNKLRKMLGDRKGKFLIHRIAAISQNIEKIRNYDGLEELIESCLDNENDEKQQKVKATNMYANRELAQSSFDKFAWKG